MSGVAKWHLPPPPLELWAALAWFPAEITAADAEVAAAQARVAVLRTAQKKVERELERIVGPVIG